MRGEKWERQTATILSSPQQKAMRSDIDRDEAINERWVDNLRAWALFYPLTFPHPRFRYDSRYMRLLRGDILDAFENILTDLDQRSSIHAV